VVSYFLNCLEAWDFFILLLAVGIEVYCFRSIDHALSLGVGFE